VRLNAHVIVPGKKGEAQLWLAPITLGDDALIGGYCLITAGCTIPAGTSAPAGKYFRPFSTWQDDQPAQSRSEGDSN
jgi:acetyltransferase-like isoleucine patch superfamily enzyme